MRRLHAMLLMGIGCQLPAERPTDDVQAEVDAVASCDEAGEPARGEFCVFADEVCVAGDREEGVSLPGDDVRAALEEGMDNPCSIQLLLPCGESDTTMRVSWLRDEASPEITGWRLSDGGLVGRFYNDSGNVSSDCPTGTWVGPVADAACAWEVAEYAKSLQATCLDADECDGCRCNTDGSGLADDERCDDE